MARAVDAHGVEETKKHSPTQLLLQHRKINEALQEEIARIHAFSIKRVFTPAEYEAGHPAAP